MSAVPITPETSDTVSGNIAGADRSEATPCLEALRKLIASWLHIPREDADLIDVALAVVKSQDMPGDPLWCMIADASGGGKTELLRAFRSRSNIEFLSSLTEKTLVSGYRDPNKPKDDPSLLPKLDKKVLIIKDLSPLLSMRRESRNIVISTLRDAYDGFTDEGRGNIGKVHYESRFSVLAAGTPALDRADAFDGELGERFVKFRCRGTASEDKVRKAIDNIGSEDTMRRDIEKAIADFLDSLPSITTFSVPPHMREKLASLADFTAKARSHVTRDRNGDLQYHPRPEVGTRLVKELGKLLLALAAVRGKGEPDRDDFMTVARVAEDCLPPNRLAVINALKGRKKELTVSEVVTLTGLPDKTVRRTLDDLHELGICKGEKTPWSDHDPPDLWSLMKEPVASGETKEDGTTRRLT